MSKRRLGQKFGMSILLVFLTLTVVDTASPKYPRRNAVVEAVEKVRNAVVNISTESIRQGLVRLPSFGPFEDFFPPLYSRRNYQVSSLGTGVIVSSDGYVVTNAHVVRESVEIKVTLVTGETYDASYVGADIEADVGILKISAEEMDFPAISLDTHDDLMIGETVIVVGNPFGLQNTVTTGVISAVDRSIQTDEGIEFSGIIQTDAAINPGNSGGPLLDINGELVGVAVAVQAGAENIGFAIPVSKVRRTFNEMVRGYACLQEIIGAEIHNISGLLAKRLELPSTEGVVVTEVSPGALGAEAGLEPGDVIVKISGESISNVNDFCRTVESLDNPKQVPDISLQVKRRAKDKTFKIAGEKIVQQRKQKTHGFPWLGMKVVSIDSVLARRLGVSLSYGVVVQSIAEGSPAAAAGLNVGDILLKIGSERVKSVSDFQQITTLFDSYKKVEILIRRGAQEYIATLSRNRE